MRSFEILGLSRLSGIEKVESAYNKKILELLNNRQLYPESLYENKVHELEKAKAECISYCSLPAVDRIKKQVSEAYKYHTGENVLHDCGLWCTCTSCLSKECYEFGAASTAGSVCCIDMILCSPFAMIVYMFLGGAFWYKNSGHWKEKRENKRLRDENQELYRQCEIEAKKHLVDEYGYVKYSGDIEVVATRLLKERLREQARKAADDLIKEQEAERQRRIIAEKTKRIHEQSKFLDEDITRWKELWGMTSCVLSGVDRCNNLLSLLEKADTSDDRIENIRQSLVKYRECAEKKQEILERAQKVAQLYQDIGNLRAAEELLEKYMK